MKSSNLPQPADFLLLGIMSSLSVSPVGLLEDFKHSLLQLWLIRRILLIGPERE